MTAMIRINPCSRGGFFARIEGQYTCASGGTLEQALMKLALRWAGYQGVYVPHEGDESLCYRYDIQLTHVRTDLADDAEIYKVEASDYE